VGEEYPSYPLAQTELGDLCRERKDLDGAVAHYTKAAEATPCAEAWLRVGVAQADQKKHEEALATLKKAEEMSPGDLDVQDAFARIHLETQQFKEALERFEKIAKAIPSDTSARLGRAVCLEKLDRKADAVTELEGILKVDPVHAGAMERLIGLYEGNEAKAGERAKLQKRLEWVRKNPPKVKPIAAPAAPPTSR
jgi:tetratricopeptide (TPR) repeat protein